MGAFLTIDGAKAGLKERLEDVVDINGIPRVIQYKNCAVKFLNFSRCNFIRNWEIISITGAYGEQGGKLLLQGTTAGSHLRSSISTWMSKKEKYVVKEDVNQFWSKKLDAIADDWRKRQAAQQAADEAAALSAGRKPLPSPAAANAARKEPLLDGEWVPLRREGWDIMWW
eukprot:GDKK01021089.1.p1 GENE.GDKK01021089.1~~GDKK01021089.1.p1  ORF type:complete len:170 (-),score=42.16 GDKK01021089.1:55-564(-)